MSTQTSQQLESFLPVYDSMPENWQEARQYLVEQLKMIANSVNAKEIGWILEEELLNGCQFQPSVASSGQYRSVFRKLVDFGALPDTSRKPIPHGLSITDRFTLIELTACATDPVGLTSLSLPFASSIANENIKLFLDSTNVIIETAKDYSSYSRCFVIINYIQEL